MSEFKKYLIVSLSLAMALVTMPATAKQKSSAEKGHIVHENSTRDPKLEPEWVQERRRQRKYIQSYNHQKLWDMVDALESRQSVRNFLIAEFKEFLADGERYKVELEYDPDITFRQFPYHLIYLILRDNPDAWHLIDNYLEKTVPELEEQEKKIQAQRDSIGRVITEEFGIEGFGTNKVDRDALNSLRRTTLIEPLKELNRVLNSGALVNELIKANKKISEADKDLGVTIGRRVTRINNIEGPLKERSAEIAGVFRQMATERLDLSDRMDEVFNPLSPIYLSTKSGKASIYKVVDMANHTVKHNGKELPPADLLEHRLEVIRKAKKGDTLIFSYYDFDLVEIAKEIEKAVIDRGVKVLGAIDKKVVEAGADEKGDHYRKGVADSMKVFRRIEKALDEKETPLEERQFFLRLAESSNLMHQKFLMVMNRQKGEAVIETSSGNATRSGIHPDGDNPAGGEKSRPNANNTRVYYERVEDGESLPMAEAMYYEIGKKLIINGYRGTGKSTTSQMTFLPGSSFFFEVEGNNYLIGTVSPSGSLGDINQRFVGRMLQETDGPTRGAFFAISSEIVNTQLLKKLERQLEQGLQDVKAGRIKAADFKLDFRVVGETVFAMSFWSEMIAMSGLKRPSHLEIKDGAKDQYVEIELENNPWKKLLTDKRYKKLASGKMWDQVRSNIFIAAKDYFGNFPMEKSADIKDSAGDGNDRLSVKFHHKTIVSGPASMNGTTGNFSAAAQANNELWWTLVHQNAADYTVSMIDSLIKMNDWVYETVTAEAHRRNRRNGVRSNFNFPKTDIATCEMALRGKE